VIVTLTPNPSIDRTLVIPDLVRGDVIRARDASSEAGGKGINVTRALVAQGHASLAVAPLSPASAAVFRELLAGACPLEDVAISGELRTNISLVEADGTVTKVNEPGPTLTEADASRILERVASLAPDADWVVGSGSLPPGIGADFYARLVQAVPAGVRVAIDVEGDALRTAAAAGAALIKPNRRELEGLVGRPLDTLGEVVEAAAALVDDGVGAVLVSLGPDGAAYVDRSGSSHAEGRLVEVANTVGAGDALLAGFLANGSQTLAALGEAVAWSIAACRSPGTTMGAVQVADREAVTVHRHADPQRRLAA
jgi:1-phosphofructokinase